MNEPEFYVGYFPQAPRSLGRFVRIVAGLAVALAIGIAAAVSANQDSFAPSYFEFGQYRTYTGVLISNPVPMLIDGPRAWLLSGPGKHGVPALVEPMHGRTVELRGALARNGPDAMLEILPAHIRSVGTAEIPQRIPLGSVSLSGEIVDSKCHLGVMNPGRGKVHRDCAVRCISGGIPPVLLVHDAKRPPKIVILAGPNLSRGVLDRIAEPVNVAGHLYRIGDKTFLETDIAEIVRIGRE